MGSNFLCAQTSHMFYHNAHEKDTETGEGRRKTHTQREIKICRVETSSNEREIIVVVPEKKKPNISDHFENINFIHSSINYYSNYHHHHQHNSVVFDQFQR